jgi:hypothetical protein
MSGIAELYKLYSSPFEEMLVFIKLPFYISISSV